MQEESPGRLHSTGIQQVPIVQLCMHLQVRNERSALANALEAAKKELTGYKEDVVHGFQSERAKASALESRTRAQVSTCPAPCQQVSRSLAAGLQGSALFTGNSSQKSN